MLFFEVLKMRTGQSEPLGKCTEELKTLVPEDLHDDIVALSRLAGVSKSEYLRMIVNLHVNGHLSNLRLQLNQNNAMAGKGQE